MVKQESHQPASKTFAAITAVSMAGIAAIGLWAGNENGSEAKGPIVCVGTQEVEAQPGDTLTELVRERVNVDVENNQERLNVVKAIGHYSIRGNHSGEPYEVKNYADSIATGLSAGSIYELPTECGRDIVIGDK